MNETETPMNGEPSSRSASTDAAPPTNETGAPGARLAALRTSQQRSVSELAAAMKLPRSILEAIEADRMETIAPIYRRGYIANYARELGASPDEFLPGPSTDELPPLRGVLPPPVASDRVDRFVRFATYFLVTTLIVPPLVYFFVTGGTRLFDLDDGSPSPIEAVTDAVTDEGELEGGDDSTARRNDVTRRIARALSLEGANESREGPMSASTLPLAPLRASDPEVVDPAPSAAEPPEASPLHPLSIELIDDSWVEISDARGERLEFDLLRAGAERSYQALPPVRVLLGRANAVQVRFDGAPVAFEGADSGSVAEFVLDAPSAESAPADPSDSASDASREPVVDPTIDADA